MPNERLKKKKQINEKIKNKYNNKKWQKQERLITQGPQTRPQGFVGASQLAVVATDFRYLTSCNCVSGEHS